MTHFIDFKVGGFKVGEIGSSSGVFIGQNLQYGWRDSAKQNVSSRSVTGDCNFVQDANNLVFDPDLLDTWVQKPYPWANERPPSPILAKLHQERKRQYRKASR